uniref:Uncharacterized protein n=1 Tax=Oryza nivara TaxID=4536 RepID=A0A0E0IHP2_ORYNI
MASPSSPRPPRCEEGGGCRRLRGWRRGNRRGRRTPDADDTAVRTIIAEAKVQAEAGGKHPSQEAKRRPRRLIDPTPTRKSERQKVMANVDAPVANRAEFLKKIHNLEVVAGYLHVFLLAPLLVYDAATGGAGYYA